LESAKKHYLLFFTTGNPGLIGYYTAFLSRVSQLLSSSSQLSTSDAVFTIYGCSLKGFEDEDGKGPYSLEEVIEEQFKVLDELRIDVGEKEGHRFDGVILCGHSVGAYITLEMIRMAQEKARLSRAEAAEKTVSIDSAILLFPTVTHIAASPSGQKLTQIVRIPSFPWLAHTLAKTALWPLPDSTLRSLVGKVTSMPDDASEVTTKFLRSRKGIEQALYMAADEMRTITEDKWDSDIWGVEHDEKEKSNGIVVHKKIPKLIFYFGQNDHWVADHTRDALIKARGAMDGEDNGSKPKMVLDESGIPHGFCIKHSEPVAGKVAGWVEDIIKSQS
jgi:pimeloyl-ACP methyl ester carboxylesterase